MKSSDPERKPGNAGSAAGSGKNDVIVKTLRKGLWLTLGTLFFLLGIVGSLFPVLPGFVFFILALFSFMRCSRRFNSWVQRQHWFIRLKKRFHHSKPE
ncbi:MAG: uncharacterized protein PWQ29_895 [Verrucomicrobiota bacterium]|jgi:uncharacterized membrane protein YbaN (DUF454 family)|nr:uncharacterized protein [Verrucomicrobiota bacterium]MDK2963501.1 uncharacterized protein [Verrucomicrobiota bacterium]